MPRIDGPAVEGEEIGAALDFLDAAGLSPEDMRQGFEVLAGWIVSLAGAVEVVLDLARGQDA